MAAMEIPVDLDALTAALESGKHDTSDIQTPERDPPHPCTPSAGVASGGGAAALPMQIPIGYLRC